ncbi:MAG TPA: bifunctional phosphoribosyl-AMP cyclohydrolase/phosphoribosyl-ATP diphosphatase HisIE [Anaerovoracaceae bacterium]|nr:bifunctional phosphoribosyl-AMP cyclohydrolase/phosphoribosyl-ATP diphosphatase HisIE [Anaerovoracaceae bacterium]
MDLSKFFAGAPLIPAVIQEKSTRKVLMLAYMNEESLRKTIETGYTWFFSRSRNKLWNKGETSGHVQKVVRITGDCDDDTLLIEVEQTGPACHTGNEACFYQEPVFKEPTSGSASGPDGAETGASESDAAEPDALQELYQVVLDRRTHFAENSYTCYLFEKGLDKILKKCGEECSEVIIAAKNVAALGENMREAALTDVKNEICDLLYHLTVLMVNEGIRLEEINEILKQRSQKIGNLKTLHETDRNS